MQLGKRLFTHERLCARPRFEIDAKVYSGYWSFIVGWQSGLEVRREKEGARRGSVKKVYVCFLFFSLFNCIFIEGYEVYRFESESLEIKALAKRTRKSIQVDASLQNQNLCVDLQWAAKRIRKSARKFTQVWESRKFHACTVDVRSACVDLHWVAKRWKLGPTCVRIWTRPKPTQVDSSGWPNEMQIGVQHIHVNLSLIQSTVLLVTLTQTSTSSYRD